MSAIEFFEYLADHEQTHDLAVDLADVWAAHEAADVKAVNPAA